MKRFFVLVCSFMFVGCSYVEPGYVGIKVNKLGGDKGVDSQVLGVGRYWIGMNEELYRFPTFQQNVTWAKSPTDGGDKDESITFQTKEGMTVNADFGISYSIDPTKVSVLFQKYRKGVEEITDIYLRNTVRDAINDESSKLAVEEVYGDKKTELLDSVQKKVADHVSEIGILVEKIYLVGEMRLPETVRNSLNAKIEATQNALKVRNEVETAKAQAEKEIAIAEGVAKANKIKAESLSESLIRWETIQKWNGVLPSVTGSNSMINVPMK